MKLHSFHPLKTLAICVAASSTMQAATISTGTATMVVNNGSNESYRLSVFDGKASYRPFGAPNSTTLGDGQLLDYRFVTSTTGAFNTYAQGSGNRISVFTAPSGNIAASAAEDSWVNLWTTTDPGTNFSSVTPNYTDSQITHARTNRAAGTINIAGLTSGTLYFVHGSFIGATDFTLTMTGTGQTDVVRTFNVASPGNTNRGWISDFGFDNAGGLYDTISFTYATNDSVTRGRFMGVMLDAIPEPSSSLMVLGSLLGLCLRRRR